MYLSVTGLSQLSLIFLLSGVCPFLCLTVRGSGAVGVLSFSLSYGLGAVLSAFLSYGLGVVWGSEIVWVSLWLRFLAFLAFFCSRWGIVP